MKRFYFKASVLMSGIILAAGLSLYAQSTILQEQFGMEEWTGDPAFYPAYTSDALFSGDAPHDFPASTTT